MAVVDLNLVRRFPYAEGREFGEAGPYEQIDAVLTFAVDPSAEANSLIVDLQYAPLDSDGRVRFTADFSIVRPVDPGRGANRLLVEIPNRGRRRVVDSLNRTGTGPAASADPGDGFLFERGFTIATIGWQWDVPVDDVLMGLNPPVADLSAESDPGKNVLEIRPNIRESTRLLADRVHTPLRAKHLEDPDAVLYVKDFEDDPGLTVVPRSKWKFARETPDGLVPSDEHIYLDGGFEPGKCYQLIYSTKDSPVVGAGLLAVRDVASFLKYDSATLLPGLGTFDFALGYGASQSGRLLRHFLYLGLNVDEQGRKVFDGLLPHVAGGRLGTFNHRYAQPSNHPYPGFAHVFPFADANLTDPFSDNSDGILKRLKENDAVPKVIYTNTSAEYWRGDCSLTHTDPAARTDLEPEPSVRSYHFAGTQHGAGTLPQDRDPGAENALGMYDYDVVDYSPLMRAAFVNLEKWVAEGIEPPPSAHARIDSETAVARSVVLDYFDQLPDQLTLNRSKLWIVRTIDLGARAAEGVGEYPPIEGETYPCLVSAVDHDGNEVAGIRLPDLTQPVGTHAGWNLRDPETGAPDQLVPMLGFTKWFSATRNEREAAGDPRLSVEERYRDRDEYIELARRDAEALAKDSFVLEQDIELVVQNAADRYDVAVVETPAGLKN